MTGKQLMGGLGAIATRLTKADYKRLYEEERAGTNSREYKRIDELIAALKKHGSHDLGCGAYKVIGRFGSRTGLLWAEATDSKTCTCGLGAAIRGKS